MDQEMNDYESLHRRIARLEDKLAIKDVLSKYAFFADSGRGEEWVGLFTEDGVMEVALPERPPRESLAASQPSDSTENSPDRVFRAEGGRALTEFINDPDFHKAIEGSCLHLMGLNLRISVDGDTAKAYGYNLTTVRTGDQVRLLNGAVSRFDFVRKDERWLISRCLRRRPGSPDFDRIVGEQGIV